jgi:ParB family chromosome partitioning protein
MTTPTKNLFKRRTIAEDRVIEAEISAASAPIVADPRTPTASAIHVIAAARGQDTSAAYVAGNVYEVPLERIKSNPFNPRAVYTSAAVDELARSLAQNGQRVATTGFVEGSHVVLIEGETRLRAARAAGLATLRIEIHTRPINDQQLYELARSSNTERRNQTPLDDAIRWKELLEKKVYESQTALALALNIPNSSVSRTLALAELPLLIVQTLTEYPTLLTFQMLNAVREFHSTRGDDDTIALIHNAAKNDLGYRDVAAQKTAPRAAAGKRPRATREPLRYGNAKGEVKTFEDGRLQLVLKGLTGKEAVHIVGKFKEIFS